MGRISELEIAGHLAADGKGESVTYGDTFTDPEFLAPEHTDGNNSADGALSDAAAYELGYEPMPTSGDIE